MKISDLTEAPISDYEVLDNNHPMLAKASEQSIQKTVRQVFDKVDADVNIYFIHQPLITQNIYFEITQRTYSWFPKDVQEKVRALAGTDKIGIVFNVEGEFPNLTPWAIAHDLVHGITLGSRADMEFFDKLDDILLDFRRHNKLAFGDILDLLTMQSAKNGGLVERPLEITTELFTQWIFKGKVVFNYPDWMSSDESNHLQKIEAIFNSSFARIIQRAKGRSFYTSA